MNLSLLVMVTVVITVLTCTTANGYELTPSVFFRLDSDAQYKGISESNGDATILLATDLAISSNWLAGFSYRDSTDSIEQQRDRSVSSFISYQYELNNNYFFSVSATRRIFPGSIKEWDFTEIESSLLWKESIRLSAAYSDNYYAHDTQSWSAKLSWFSPISKRFYLFADIEKVKINTAVINGYNHFSMGLGWRQGSLSTELTYGYNNRAGEVLFGDTIESLNWQYNLNYLVW